MRLLLLIPPAALVTILILGLIIKLIDLVDHTVTETEVVRIADIYMPKTIIETRRSIEKPEKIELHDVPPPTPKQHFDRTNSHIKTIPINLSNIKPDLDINIGSRLNVNDGEYLPIVKIAPQYPRRALSQGIEGYVILEYTVTTSGSVETPVIIESKPKNVFDKAAIKSALRYKYKPRVIDGQATAVTGVRTKITFKLDQ